MNNPNPKLRSALGISALTAFSLVMIGCGGSSSSAPVIVNAAPGGVTIAGPTAAVTQHSYIYNLSAVDPEGDAITFSTTTTGATVSGSVLTYTPTATGAPATISVIATDKPNSTEIILANNINPPAIAAISKLSI